MALQVFAFEPADATPKGGEDARKELKVVGAYYTILLGATRAYDAGGWLLGTSRVDRICDGSRGRGFGKYGFARRCCLGGH